MFRLRGGLGAFPNRPSGTAPGHERLYHALATVGVAVLTTSIAAAVRWLIGPATGDTFALLPFAPSIAVSAWYGGLVCGLIATLLGAIAGNYLWMPPSYAFGISSVAEVLSIGSYCAVGALISVLNEELHRRRRELRDLAVHLQSVREEELARLSREIHDELGQLLTCARMDLSRIDLGRFRREEVTAVEHAKTIITEAVDVVRAIATRLRPRVLDEFGLVAAIEWLAAEVSRHTDVRCHLTPPTEEPVLDGDSSIALFRIFQEALTNAVKHASATDIDILIDVTPDELRLEVSDNGVGITTAQRSAGQSFGLLGMRERALILGGELEVTGTPGEGTRVGVRIPRRRPPDTPAPPTRGPGRTRLHHGASD